MNENYFCILCETEYTFKNDYDDHMKECGGICPFCQGLFRSRELEKHANICGEKKDACPICNLMFDKQDLKNHVNKCLDTNDQIKIECRYCYWGFSEKEIDEHQENCFKKGKEIVIKEIEKEENSFQQKILLLGNPGAGKSTILNCLIGKVIFESGMSFGTGLSQYLKTYKHEGIIYGDTPGLSDVLKRKEAAKEITKALQQNGIFKIIFVVTVNSGRVSPDDLITLNCILDAFDHPVPFGIIVNKISQKLYDVISQDKESRERLFLCFNSGNHKTDFFHHFIRNEELVEANGGLIKLPEDLLDFIYKKVPPFIVRKEEVKEVKADNYEILKEQSQQIIDMFLQRSDMIEKDYKETISKIENEYKKIYEDTLNKEEIYIKQIEKMRKEQLLDDDRFHNFQKKNDLLLMNLEEQIEKRNQGYCNIL
eukprot:TRINITY_DN2251_c0_g2_i1.p1 TRINITY_DN2251_c0_g2~~TRINITY_DN2251_c0_g2_i1.p1  ORF type:complete len:425 (-),score=118.72 TRINITY_DN2251_c0_g2_i1:35-1309(-)